MNRVNYSGLLQNVVTIFFYLQQFHMHVIIIAGNVFYFTKYSWNFVNKLGFKRSDCFQPTFLHLILRREWVLILRTLNKTAFSLFFIPSYSDVSNELGFTSNICQKNTVKVRVSWTKTFPAVYRLPWGPFNVWYPEISLLLLFWPCYRRVAYNCSHNNIDYIVKQTNTAE